ncbi:MAG: cytochrome C biogenesis protein [Elusimicrobia bacterium CG11_big_fil_rev_8_21_14_0_20_64_6]|nr:MAG: cytochrome C biogenesis protein [Elusimicrobia bacterium CG11_big_fil_rev_8_21_14_0_20_64_6]
MGNGTVGYGAALLGGLVSFLSPCVLPLVPGYISFMSGLTLEELAAGGDDKTRLRHAGWESLCFVAGFALIFTLLGATATTIGRLLAEQAAIVSKIAGAVVILFGLHLTGVMPIKWLYYQKRADTAAFKAGYVGSFFMGLAFAFGWTPCIGPILSGILAIAATRETVAQGMSLLFAYSLGLGIPFIATGFAVTRFMRFFVRYKKYIRTGEIAAGVLLIAIGLLIFLNKLAWLNSFTPKFLNRFLL